MPREWQCSTWCRHASVIGAAGLQGMRPTAVLGGHGLGAPKAACVRFAGAWRLVVRLT